MTRERRAGDRATELRVDRSASAALPRRVDVCNGDADGLCAVVQWRRFEPADATLVTGMKRDIELLRQVPPGTADEVLVCDLSMQRNRAALLGLLDAGVRVRYFDHHSAGEVPRHAGLEAHLATDPDTCTSLLVDAAVGGRSRAWALVGAYGDSLGAVADRIAAHEGIAAPERERLRRLGETINYNAYGDSAADACVDPARMYGLMAKYPDPQQMADEEPVVAQIDRVRQADLRRAAGVAPRWCSRRACVLVLPDAPWSRRVIGALANRRADAHPDQAQAVLKDLPDGGLRVSVRAPRSAPRGASELCARFGGSGRAAAAGIDCLPREDLPSFVEALEAARWG